MGHTIERNVYRTFNIDLNTLVYLGTVLGRGFFSFLFFGILGRGGKVEKEEGGAPEVTGTLVTDLITSSTIH